MTDKELTEQLQTIIEMMGTLATKQDVREAETRINIKIENELTRRLDALTDGYKLNHEKQYELERRMEALERRIERLESAG